MIAATLGTDQIVKWFAWRHFAGSLINSGGYVRLWPVVRSWFAAPVSGAFADAFGVVLVLLGIAWVLLRRRPLQVVIGAGMVSSGWLADILDRLGMHNWTAPGSARGVVDFLPSGANSRSNLADLAIVIGTVLLGYAAARRRLSDRQTDGNRPRSVLRSVGAQLRRRPVVAVIVTLAILTLTVTSEMDHTGVHSATSSR